MPRDRLKQLECKRRYRESHKEEIKEANKLYWEKNKISIQAKQKVKHVCVCGGLYSNNYKAKHLRTKKHQSYIENNDN